MSYSPPVLLKTEPDLQVDERLYYEIASNGVFQVKDTELYRAVTRVTREVPGLYPSRERLQMRFPSLPAGLLEPVIAFFAEVYERYEAEAIVLLFYRPESQAYRVLVPPQRISGYRDSYGNQRAYLRLDYGTVVRPKGFRAFGTLHSHADLSAYASATDCDDERFGDGLHVVFGHFGTSVLSRCVAFVASGRRFHVEPEHVLPPCEPAAPTNAVPAAWMQQVSFEESKGWAEANGWSFPGSDLPVLRAGDPDEA